MSLKYRKDKESFERYPAIGIYFDKRFIYENSFIKSKLRVVKYDQSDSCYIYLNYFYKSDPTKIIEKKYSSIAKQSNNLYLIDQIKLEI
jgi:hypothetical protein